MGETGQQIGAAKVIDIDLPEGSQDAGFYAIAYEVPAGAWEGLTEDTIVISYRGTDGFLTDFGTGYGIGNGNYEAEQAKLAAEFYAAVAASEFGVSADELTLDQLREADIVLTGHSMGGGIAGFVAGLYGKEAAVYDSMAFEDAVSRAVEVASRTDFEIEAIAATLPGDLDFNRAQLIAARETAQNLYFAGVSPEGIFDTSDITGTYINGDFLNSFLTPWSASDPANDVLSTFSNDLDPIQLHSISLLAIRSFGDSTGSNGSNAWIRVANEAYSSLFSDNIAELVGFPIKDQNGTNTSAEKMRAAIAYSALDEGERPFGDVSVRAWYDDLNDLGLLGVDEPVPASVRKFVNNGELVNLVTQFAGTMAFNDVEAFDENSLPNDNSALLNGILNRSTSIIDGVTSEVLELSFAKSLWNAGADTDGLFSDGDVAALDSELNTLLRSNLFEHVLDKPSVVGEEGGLLGIDIKNALHALYDATSSDFIDFFAFAIGTDGVDYRFDERGPDSGDLRLQDETKASLFVGTGKKDMITGSNGDDIAFGAGGRDTLIGGDGSDLLNGGRGNDTLFAGSEDDLPVDGVEPTEVTDTSSNALFGADGDDLMVGAAGSDILVGGEGDDEIYGLDGADIIYGGAGIDVIDAGDGADFIDLGGRPDEPIPDFMLPREDDEPAPPLPATETANAGDGNDFITGFGNNIIEVSGGAGNDYIDIAGATNWTTLLFEDGFGNDTIAYDRQLLRDQAVDGDLPRDTNEIDYPRYTLDFSAMTSPVASVTYQIDEQFFELFEETIFDGDVAFAVEGGWNGFWIGSALIEFENGDSVYLDGIFGLIDGYYEQDLINGTYEGDTEPVNRLPVLPFLEGLSLTAADFSEVSIDAAIYGTALADYSADGDPDLTFVSATDPEFIGLDFTTTFDGTNTDDSIDGGSTDDIINGGAGNDTIRPGGGTDNVDAGQGDDIIRADDDNADDVFDGGEGVDRLNYGSADSDIIVDLEQGAATGDSIGADTLIDIENITTGNGNDNIAGNYGDNKLFGGAGVDIIFGALGNDVLRGGSGADQLNGGEGVDRADYFGSDAGVSIDLSTGAASGGDAEGDILLDIENLSGSSFADILSGDDGQNLLIGRDGDDVLFGLSGNDRLIGGRGDDILTGGLGADQFMFELGDGNDIITDFAPVGQGDTIRFSGVEGLDFETLLSNAIEDGGDVVFNYGEGSTLRLEAVSLSDLTAADFEFL